MTRRPRALQDLREQAAYLDRELGSEAALAFLEAAESTFRWLTEMPGAGAPLSTATHPFSTLRVWPVKGFDRMLIFYGHTESEIEVIRLLHSRQDWRALFDHDE